MIKPELKKKRDIRLNVLIEKFQKKLKEAKRMENNKKKAMEYAPNQTNKNTYERSDQKQTHTNVNNQTVVGDVEMKKTVGTNQN